MTDAILGHGDKKESLKSFYITISDADPIRAIDMMKFDTGDTEIGVQKTWWATVDGGRGDRMIRQLSKVSPEPATGPLFSRDRTFVSPANSLTANSVCAENGLHCW